LLSEKGKELLHRGSTDSLVPQDWSNAIWAVSVNRNRNYVFLEAYMEH
jgi:hypothetical protein